MSTDDLATAADELELLPIEEAIDPDRFDVDIYDAGYSPLDRSPADLKWGFTVNEQRRGEPLAARLARELPEFEDEIEWDGIGDATDTDGEIIDDQVGSLRAGRLALADLTSLEPQADFWANDLGIDAGAASAEEAAVHIVVE